TSTITTGSAAQVLAATADRARPKSRAPVPAGRAGRSTVSATERDTLIDPPESSRPPYRSSLEMLWLPTVSDRTLSLIGPQPEALVTRSRFPGVVGDGDERFAVGGHGSRSSPGPDPPDRRLAVCRCTRKHPSRCPRPPRCAGRCGGPGTAGPRTPPRRPRRWPPAAPPPPTPRPPRPPPRARRPPPPPAPPGSRAPP